MSPSKKTIKNILCWNVNGIRALAKKGGFQWILEHNPDVFCLQETKAHPDQLGDDLRNPGGYSAYFDHSKLKKGYSGVAIYTKILPTLTEDAFLLSPDSTDQEGRFYQVEYEDFVLINCYFPNGGGLPERLAYKLSFYDAFILHLDRLIQSNKEVIVCGDFNIVHKELDAKRFKENKGNIGFLPEEQAKLDQIIKLGFTDIYRHFYPEGQDYTWWDMKSFARERGIGWRIDTFFATEKIKQQIKSIKIHTDIIGSDHCPVEILFK